MVGERAIRECIDQGRATADKCSGPERSAILKLCDELDQLTDELANLKRRGMVGCLVVRSICLHRLHAGVISAENMNMNMNRKPTDELPILA